MTLADALSVDLTRRENVIRDMSMSFAPLSTRFAAISSEMYSKASPEFSNLLERLGSIYKEVVVKSNQTVLILQNRIDAIHMGIQILEEEDLIAKRIKELECESTVKKIKKYLRNLFSDSADGLESRSRKRKRQKIQLLKELSEVQMLIATAREQASDWERKISVELNSISGRESAVGELSERVRVLESKCCEEKLLRLEAETKLEELFSQQCQQLEFSVEEFDDGAFLREKLQKKNQAFWKAHNENIRLKKNVEYTRQIFDETVSELQDLKGAKKKLTARVRELHEENEVLRNIEVPAVDMSDWVHKYEFIELQQKYSALQISMQAVEEEKSYLQEDFEILKYKNSQSEKQRREAYKEQERLEGSMEILQKFIAEVGDECEYRGGMDQKFFQNLLSMNLEALEKV